MRAPTCATTLRCTLPLAFALSAAGCGTIKATLRGYATGPRGIEHSQQRLRDALSAGDFTTALEWGEGDALLRALNVGISSYYAAQYARSAAVLDTAALLADDRITASLTKDGLALVTNDVARPYQPRRTERLFIPYYGMLAYARLEQWDDAAVEARRLVALLAQYAEDRDPREVALHASLQHLAGAVFDRAGEHQDADVAYRGAHALSPAFPEGTTRDSSTGEILVVVERGYVAHRATAYVRVPRDDDDRDSLPHDGASHRVPERVARPDIAPTGSGPNAQVSAVALPGNSTVPRRRHHDDDDDLLVALPELRRSSRPWIGSARVSADGRTIEGTGTSVAIDDASAADQARERLAIMARALGRAAVKYTAVKAVKDKKGEVAGTIAEMGSKLLERADVRSWHLLPQQLVLARVRIPAGSRSVRVEIGDGSLLRIVELGNVDVRAGTVTIIPVRLWRDPPSVMAPPVVIAAADTVCTAHYCP